MIRKALNRKGRQGRTKVAETISRFSNGAERRGELLKGLLRARESGNPAPYAVGEVDFQLIGDVL